MNRNTRHHRYGAFISLGSTCQTAHQLSRLGLRRHAAPLDWFISKSIPGLTKLLRNEFKGFMDGKSLQLLGTTADHYIVRDTAYQIDSYHDFPLTEDPARWSEPYPMFKDKMNRRIRRFLETIRSRPVCFVRLEASKAEAQELELALRRLTRQPFQLLVVNVKRTLSPEPAWEEWDIRRVRSVTVPAGFDWRGSNQAWDAVMRDFTSRCSND